MAESIYTAKIDHTESTLEALFKTQFYTYNTLRMVLRLIIGAAAAVLALLLQLPMWGRGIMLLVGCWLLVSKDFPAQMRADRAMLARNGSLPKMRYKFGDDSVNVSGEGTMDISYKKFARLVEDTGYFYIFMSKDSVCMIDKESIRPGSAEEFKTFIMKKTGLTWRREKALILMNIQDIREMISDQKKK